MTENPATDAAPRPRERLNVGRHDRAVPGVDDVFNLSVFMTVIGLALVLVGLTVRFLTGRDGGIFGAGIAADVTAGLNCSVGIFAVIAGRGLRRFEAWAWCATVFALVPLFSLIAVAAYVPAGLTGYACLASVLGCTALYYTLDVLIFGGGRKRYAEMARALYVIRENPDSLSAKTLLKK